MEGEGLESMGDGESSGDSGEGIGEATWALEAKMKKETKKIKPKNRHILLLTNEKKPNAQTQAREGSLLNTANYASRQGNDKRGLRRTGKWGKDQFAKDGRYSPPCIL